MYTPSVASEESDGEDIAVAMAIPQLPKDVGTPVLEPYMRRLRHVVGVALRNITWDTKQVRKSSISDIIRHGSVSSTDEGFNSSIGATQPTSTSQTHQTQTGGSEISGVDLGRDADDESVLESPTKSRRRRTIRAPNQIMFNPEVQQALHDLNSERLLDTMFALYVPGRTKPIYISEMVTGSMNPEFTEIDLPSNLQLSGSSTSSSSSNSLHSSTLGIRSLTTFVISVWGRIDTSDQSDTNGSINGSGSGSGTKKWKNIFTEVVDLAKLNFIGKSMDTITMAFPLNSVVVYLTDGCYVLPKAQILSRQVNFRTRHDSAKSTSSRTHLGHNHTNGYAVPSLTFDSIMKLNNLEECIADAQATITSVSEAITEKLRPYDSNLLILSKRRSELEQKHSRIKNRIDRETQATKTILQQINDQKKSIQARKLKLSQEMGLQKEAKMFLTNETATLTIQKQEIHSQVQLATVELARISTCLQEIFPIERRRGSSSNNDKRGEFSFTICGLDLPDATAAAIATRLYDEDEIAAAYGLVTQLVYLLSCYIGVPLRYPVQAYGSQSFVVDPISAIQGSRSFPLWTKGSIFYRFEYGVYLFHKDIEQLVNSASLPVVDLRHTLANIKNLLLVLSSPGTTTKKIEI
ncbi:UV radiation resistance-associated gene protein [Sugiyamaella lignohabitans]|uniref:Autophagy-related protein 14 n=1 Tax=Sugiyamaella lignohabitans TaxID=796027 RepID=A0A167CA25_9ASCO|nr:UV radiation resistance-associated gene protein [Sugiyamaella lignohabitans]ANB11414.1 UV radiation resistance-associated gene protein [Sugiyamaella lignohabitans]